MSFRGVQRVRSRDLHGSVHILEVLIVGLMVMGAVVTVSQFNTSVDGPEQNTLRVGEDRAKDVLDTLRALPASNNDVHHTHRLEEMIMQHLAGDERALPELLRANLPAQHRMLLQVGEHNRVIVGPDEIGVGDVPDGASVFWYGQMGHTFIRPTVSHQNADMDAWFELLPVWMDRVAQPPGRAYDVELDLSGNGGTFEETATFYHRLPTDSQHPLAVEPVDAVGSLKHVYSESDVTNGTNYDWELRFHILPSGDLDRVWLGQGDVFQVIAPPDWSLSQLGEDWHSDASPEDAVWDVQYTGQPMREEGEAWLNLTLQRPSSDALTHHEFIRVKSMSAAGFDSSVVLNPTASDARPAPILVVPSKPSPFPMDSSLPLTFTVTNPTSESLTLDRFLVRFTAGHQFTQTTSDWILDSSAGTTTYTYDGAPITIAAHGAETVTLQVQVTDTQEGDNIGRDLPPRMQLDSVEDDPARVSFPNGAKGLHVAVLNADTLANAPHDVRVEHAPDHRIPPGTGTFERVEDAGELLPDLQTQRHGMRLILEESMIRPGENLTLALLTAGLASVLEEHAAKIDGETIWLEIRVGDLLGHVIGQPEYMDSLEIPLSGFQDHDILEHNATFSRSAMAGPVVVDARLVIPTHDHGEVRLNFLGHAFRSNSGAETFTPVFMNAHLQFWFSDMPVQ